MEVVRRSVVRRAAEPLLPRVRPGRSARAADRGCKAVEYNGLTSKPEPPRRVGAGSIQKRLTQRRGKAGPFSRRPRSSARGIVLRLAAVGEVPVDGALQTVAHADLRAEAEERERLA